MSLRNALKPIVIGGLVAGTLDITAACVTAWLRSGVTPVRVGQYIASAAIGQAAFTGGNKTVVLGFAFHYLIATIWTIVFYLASRKLLFLIKWPIPMGLLYGVVVYLIMNFVVVPLSRVAPPRVAPPLSARALQMLILMFCIGLPIALIVRRYAKHN